MGSMSDNKFLPIDAVITWVDGQDPKHLQKLNSYLATIDGQRPRTADPTRFHNDGEINYCIISLLKFAPWIRTIYVVTDDQVPDIVYDLQGTAWENRVKIVDHKDIFVDYEHVLPTFNARSIITMVWRIPGLSERFLLLNDDFALIRPVLPEHFFHENGIVVRGKWRSFNDKPLGNLFKYCCSKLFPKAYKRYVNNRARHRDAVKATAKLTGFKEKYFHTSHEPKPLRVSTLKHFYTSHPDIFVNNFTPKLRSSNQYLNEELGIFLEMKAGHAIIDNSNWSVKIDPPDQTEQEVLDTMKSAKDSENCLFVCVQSLEKASPKLHQQITGWLDDMIGSLRSSVFIATLFLN